MAVLHRKEEKIQAVLGRLPKKYSPDDFVALFIKLYSKEWGKIKSAYIKASQDKEPGTVIHMPKPDLYLKQILEIFLTQKPSDVVEIAKEVEPVKEEVIASKPVAAIKKTSSKAKAVVKKDASVAPVAPKITKSKTPAKKAEAVEPILPVKKTRVSAKKKVD